MKTKNETWSFTEYIVLIMCVILVIVIMVFSVRLWLLFYIEVIILAGITIVNSNAHKQMG